MNSQLENQHVLITGTNSGIGFGLMQHYAAQGWRVTAVNRRKDESLEKKFPKVNFQYFDVRDMDSIRTYFKEAATTNRLPSIYILSAGINKVDNLDGFSIDVYQEVMDINLMGVMNFVSEALRYRKNRATTFVAASSTSNLFANPNCLGYFVSKLALYRSFQMFNRAYRKDGMRFKSVVLGPVATGIFVSGKLASKLQSTVRDVITVSVDQAVPPIVRFIHSNRETLYYPKSAVLLMFALRIANMILPGFYKGSAPSSSSRQTLESVVI
ncbi:MAG TPA: SDR family oxidoreductase [Candidatus Paceibacterota bacterium]